MSKVIVIVPTFNDGERAVRCVEALVAQTLDRTFTVCLVDNGSDVLPDVAHFGDRVRLLQEHRSGSYVARNLAIRSSEADILAFTDSDCLPEPGWLQAGVSRLDAPDSPGMIAGHVHVFFEDPARPTAVELYESVYAFQQKENARQGRSVTANLFVKREVFDAVGLFEEKTFSGADFEFTRRASDAGFPIDYERDSVVRHPARRELSEYRRKLTRTAGGAYKLAGLKGGEHARAFSAWGLFKDVFRPFVIYLRIFRRRPMPYRDPVSLACIAAVVFHNSWYTLYLKIRYVIGASRDFARS